MRGEGCLALFGVVGSSCSPDAVLECESEMLELEDALGLLFLDRGELEDASDRFLR